MAASNVSIRNKPVQSLNEIMAQQQALSQAEAQAVEAQLSEAYRMLGAVEYFASEDIIDALVAQELRYRFQLRQPERADAIRDELRDWGVGITRYELGDWFKLNQIAPEALRSNQPAAPLFGCSSEEQER